MKKQIALWMLFAVCSATLLVTQIAAGRYVARRAFVAPAAITAEPSLAPSEARELPEIDQPPRDETTPEDAAPAPVPTVVLPPAPLPAAAPAFDSDAAKRALAPGLESLPICRIKGAEGNGTAEIRWTPDGQVASVSVSAPFGDSPAGACIARRFMGARLPPFAGGSRAVSVSFRI